MPKLQGDAVLEQILLKVCPHCGTENKIGLSESNNITILCWACKEPLFHKDLQFVPFKNQAYVKFAEKKNPQNLKAN